jgi:LysR family hydrogen peroxide-inducible transcriptional activator
VDRVALTATSSPLPSGPAIGWSALRRERFLVLESMHCLSGQVLPICAERGVTPRIVSRGAQLATIAAMVSAGLGLSIVPEMMRTTDVEDGRVYRPFSGIAPTRELNLLWSPDRYRTNAARESARLAREHLFAVRSGD